MKTALIISHLTLLIISLGTGAAVQDILAKKAEKAIPLADQVPLFVGECFHSGRTIFQVTNSGKYSYGFRDVDRKDFDLLLMPKREIAKGLLNGSIAMSDCPADFTKAKSK